ncbi:Uncharacterized protein M6B38_247570 [Iris pallida]|uniref:N-acetyltransferase domain-containing protein n=1 Tax=Iris pallida TaxID=29817 RepID=A0AAX6DG10_IRIPA|nr:Uncharacterized protein M6B38_247570 [Iris pallida]
MSLTGGSFVPQFQIESGRKQRIVTGSRRGGRAPVLCLSRISSPSWESSILSFSRWKTVEVQCKDKLQHLRQPTVPGSSIPRHPELAFDRLQPCDEELHKGEKRAFGRFVARSALLDEEYWTAAWLRAEAHWESVSYMRHIESYKRKFADQEFYDLKRRCAGRDGNSLKCMCIVAVKKEDPNIRRTVLNSVVGTLDLSIRQFVPGETFPGVLRKASSILVSHEVCDAHRYAYIANVCVSKFARRRGIASNMLYLATEIATSSGMKQLFVHVNVENQPAQDLYKKTGFEVVGAAFCPRSKDQRLLMSMEL